MAEGRFRVPTDRWETLQSLVKSIRSAIGGRVKARKLASLAGTDISMKLVWVLVTQLYSKHVYVLVNSVFSLKYWVRLSEKAMGELLFWQQLPRLCFETEIRPCL